MVAKKERYSYTKLSTYEGCPFKFYLKYRKGMYLFSDSCASLYGNLVHYILEQEANCIKRNEFIDYDRLKEIFLTTGAKGSKSSENIYSISDISKMFPNEWNDNDTKSGMTYEEKAQDFLKNGIYDFPKFIDGRPELEIIGAEVPFNFDFRGYIFSGYIDLLMQNKITKEYVIWDIKTKDHEFPEKDLKTPLQFVCYCFALRKKYGQEIKISCFYSLPVLHKLQEAGTKGFEKRGITKINKLLDNIEGEIYKPKPSQLCYWCEFSNTNPFITENGKNVCPYYSLWTKENKVFACKLEWTGLDNYYKQQKKLVALMKLEEEDDFDIEI